MQKTTAASATAALVRCTAWAVKKSPFRVMNATTAATGLSKLTHTHPTASLRRPRLPAAAAAAPPLLLLLLSSSLFLLLWLLLLLLVLSS